MYGIALNTHLNSFYFAQLIVLLQYEYTARQKLFNCYIMKTFNTQRKSRDKRCIKLKKKKLFLHSVTVPNVIKLFWSLKISWKNNLIDVPYLLNEHNEIV